MSLRRRITYSLSGILLIMFVLVGSFIVVCTLAPSLSATSSCDLIIALKPGYGPWKAQLSASAASAVYSDGVNTARCHAQRYGPIWIVVDLEQTVVACGQGLGQECSRGFYGVMR